VMSDDENENEIVCSSFSSFFVFFTPFLAPLTQKKHFSGFEE